MIELEEFTFYVRECPFEVFFSFLLSLFVIMAQSKKKDFSYYRFFFLSQHFKKSLAWVNLDQTWVNYTICGLLSFLIRPVELEEIILKVSKTPGLDSKFYAQKKTKKKKKSNV